GGLHMRQYQSTCQCHYIRAEKAHPKQEPAKNGFIRNIYEIDLSDATAAQLKERPNCRVFSSSRTCLPPSSPASLAVLPPWHANSAKPPAWRRSADAHAPA